MKVSELIAELKQFDGNDLIAVRTPETVGAKLGTPVEVVYSSRLAPGVVVIAGRGITEAGEGG